MSLNKGAHLVFVVFMYFCDSSIFPVESLKEEEMVRSGSREQKKKMLPVGSGSGEMEDATEVVMELPTILYPEHTTTTPSATTAFGKGHKHPSTSVRSPFMET